MIPDEQVSRLNDLGFSFEMENLDDLYWRMSCIVHAFKISIAWSIPEKSFSILMDINNICVLDFCSEFFDEISVEDNIINIKFDSEYSISIAKIDMTNYPSVSFSCIRV